jgi:hypothetical protein
MANEHTQVLDDLVQAVSGHKPPSRRGWRDAAALVLAVVVGFGAGALVRSSGAFGVAPATAKTVSNDAQGIFVFASPSTKTVTQIARSSFPGVQGYDWHIGWNALEPTKGVFTFKTEDAAIAAAAAEGKSSQVAVIPGAFDPSWVVSACPDITVVSHVTRTSEKIANPATACFQNLLAPMIAAFGKHYNHNPDVVSIQATGLGLLGEMTLGVVPSGSGITAAALLSGWERAITEWRMAAPLTPSSLAIGEPLGGKQPIVNSLLTWVHTTYGAAVAIQQNGLTASTSKSSALFRDIKAASLWTTGGWQMYGFGPQNGNLNSAFHIGVAARAAFVQVYVEDVVNPSDVAALTYVENAIAGGTPPTPTPAVK